MSDEEIITKAFNDNSNKYEDWKDCCCAMMRDAITMARNDEKIKNLGLLQYQAQMEMQEETQRSFINATTLQ